ncbi:MAG: hypothetical protein A3K19_32095 [Lentisphaerae bacterium RIFOXYB12_FULL_65_16]|nr:MAG: hypothetical protein A3K18_10875 [Lentisphaerae bacterium RIFOXYA12_64_32]OGV88744.1 MAG: hypothetical protein A3K19_32095 [Lentisphaerae bacterium RIFOXYB12_FULL_65_16]
MLKGRLLVILLGMPVLLGAAGVYREVPMAEKLKDKDLTFSVTFDTRGVNADLAKGDPISTTMKDVALGLRGCVGFDTQQGFKPEPGEDLKFDALGNASPHEGSMTLWVNALGYTPGDETTDGQKRGNIALLHMLFKQDSRHIEYQLYEYGDTVYFDWRSSEPPQGWGQVGRVQVSRKGIKRNQWHQLAVTWTARKLAIYLNGEPAGEAMLPDKADKTSGLIPDARDSFIGVKSRFYEDNHTWDVAVDDLKIFSRACSPLEIKNQYARLLLDQSAATVQAYDVKLNGVNTGPIDKLDRLEAELDFSALPEADLALLTQGKLAMDYRLTRGDKTIASGQWTFSRNSECRIIEGVDQPGTYRLETSLGGKDKVSASIVRPDLSFAGNGVGAEDVVPDIWQDFAVQDHSVTLWNRVYQFGDGPLPTEVSAYGKSLLEACPRLIVETPRGMAEISYQAGPTHRSNCTVTFTGTGKAADFTLDYATTVEFDGMIKCDFTIKGSPEIKSMRLDWRVRADVCQYLLTPLLQEGQGPEFEFPYPTGGGWLTVTQLWLVSEDKGGFAYAMPHDANWVYDPARPVFFVNKASGQCSVTMVTNAVKLPESTSYQALFIATPTRPLPIRNRLIRFGDSSRSDTPHLSMNGGEGLTGVFTYEPHESDLACRLKSKVPNTVSVYGAANSLTDASDIAVYFRKYWDIPGDYIYKMSYLKPLGDGKYETEYHFTVPACNAGMINDYYLGNIKKLLAHPYGDRVWQIYYDLCGSNLCGNETHGCAFKDNFGRTIKTFALLSKRKLVERTVRFCHAQHRTVMLHAQRSYMPFLHGLADYFFPGEQHNTLLQRNPFGYTDELSDAIYRSEYNRNVLGTGVIFLPALGQANVDYFKPAAFPYTEAMLAMLLSHDVETCQDYAAGAPVQTVWDALEKYGVQSPETRVHLYYNQQEITSSQADVRVTWYECPEKRRVLILANKDIRPRNATLDVGRIAPGDFAAREEYIGADINVVAGKFNIKVPSRSFRIVAFPPKAFYPVQDEIGTVWGSWKAPESKSEFTRDDQVGRSSPGSLKMQAQGSCCFTKSFPAQPGRTYRATVYAKREAAGSVKVAFQGKNDANEFLVPPQSAQAAVGVDWQKLELRFTVPNAEAWAKCRLLLVTLSGDDGTIWFDDFTMTEE